MKVNVLGLLLAILSTPFAKGKQAQLFLKFNDANGTFTLNRDFLEEISRLQRPIRVIGTLGDARVGKSTALNLISHTWTGASHIFSETFHTGDTLAPVTRDVWGHVIQDPRDDEGSTILLDIEGINLGNGSLKDHLAMFAALFSSGLNIFTHRVLGNNHLDFLYRVARLTDVVFRNESVRNSSLENFPKLRVVVRGGLRPHDGCTLEEYIQELIAEPTFQESTREEKRMITKHFPKKNIGVSVIPFLNDRSLFKDFEKLRGSDYWSFMENLAARFKEFPVKKTRDGSPMNGAALAELAEKLVQTMNANAWSDFANVYVMIERNICRRSFVEHVQPFLSRKIDEDAAKKRLDAFNVECAVETERTAAREKLQRAIEQSRIIADLESEQEEANEKNVEEDKRGQQEDKNHQEMFADNNINDELTEENETREDAEEERENRQKQYNVSDQCKEEEEEELEWGWFDYGVFVFGGVVAVSKLIETVLDIVTKIYDLSRRRTERSDSNQSSENGTRSPARERKGSQTIKRKTFGVTLRGNRETALRENKLYPLGVTMGRDGYLRIQYALARNSTRHDQRRRRPKQ